MDMDILAIALIIVFVGLPGATALIKPASLFTFIDRFRSVKGRYIAGAIRVTIGIVFWFAAESSRDPDTVSFFSGLLIIAGIVTLLFGQKLFEDMLSWFAKWPQIAVRLWGATAVALAIWLIGLL